MKIGNKVALKQAMQLTPVGVSTPRGADLRTFDKGSEFTLVNIEGEQGIIKDSDGNFWSVLLGFLGLVQEVSQVNQNTTIGEGLTILQHIGNWFKSLGKIKFKNPFKKK
jgi:hypothetical protein